MFVQTNIFSQALRAAVWCHRFSMRELVLPWSLGSLLLLGVAAIGWLELLDVPALEPCQLQSNIRSGGGGASASVTFISFINEPLTMYWVNDRGDENNVGILAPEGDVHQNTYIKHSFRIRRPSEDGSGEVVGEYTVSKRKQTFQLHPCGTHDPWKGNSSINHQLENKARWVIPNYSRIWYAR